MSGLNKKKLKHPKEPPVSAKRGSVGRIIRFALPLLLLAALLVVAPLVLLHKEDPGVAIVATPLMQPQRVQKINSINELMLLPPDRLGELDIAEMNLLCASGLPGAERLDINHALLTLDEWAKRVEFETNRHLYRVADTRYREVYHGSEAYFRAYFLLQVLQQDLGVKYDMSAKDSFSYKDSRVAFIHGMIPAPGQAIADTPGGTCASMPIMYVAVGRRLGYPLKVVTTKGHVFARWEGLSHANVKWRERFNIEGSGSGFGSYDDNHYKTWPYKLTDADIRREGLLESLTPMEELAEFLASRGHCGFDHEQFAFAARSYESAYRYDQRRPAYRAWFLDAATRCSYEPNTPSLARLLAQRRTGGISDPELAISRQRRTLLGGAPSGGVSLADEVLPPMHRPGPYGAQPPDIMPPAAPVQPPPRFGAGQPVVPAPGQVLHP